MENNEITKTKWLIIASIITLILVSFYLYLHLCAPTLKGYEMKLLNRTQINAINVSINLNKDSTTSEATKKSIKDYLQKEYSLCQDDEIIKFIDTNELIQIQALLPTYTIKTKSFFES